MKEQKKENVKLVFLNPKREPLTKEKYRELSGLTSLSDEDAEQAAQDLQKLAKILYLMINHKKAI
jgi:hypothetical protein